MEFVYPSATQPETEPALSSFQFGNGRFPPLVSREEEFLTSNLSSRSSRAERSKLIKAAATLPSPAGLPGTMARWPPQLPPDGAHSFGHDAVALSFFVACVAATVALVSSMCSACGRKPKAASQAPAASDLKSATDSVADGGHSENLQSGSEEEEVVTLPPDLATHGPIAPVTLPASTSKRRLSMSLSKNLNMNIPDKMRLSMNIPDKMRLSRRERRDKVEPEDALWKKAIILGEKCKIPGERDGEGDADADADELAAGSFRRSSYSRPMSRSSSFAVHQHDPPALHSSHS